MPDETAVTTIAREQVDSFSNRVRAIRNSLHQVVVGQDDTIDLLLCCALTGSHALLVGVPGLAKTLMVKALASAFHWKFSRIQFTPDLMPSDITGYELLSREGNGNAPTMTFRRGPVFANLVLADEINRAAPTAAFWVGACGPLPPQLYYRANGRMLERPTSPNGGQPERGATMARLGPG